MKTVSIDAIDLRTAVNMTITKYKHGNKSNARTTPHSLLALYFTKIYFYQKREFRLTVGLLRPLNQGGPVKH